MAALFGINEWPGWVPPDDDQELPPVDADNRYEIWPENNAAFESFGSLCTKWTRDANGTPCSLDVAQIQAHLNWTVPDRVQRRQLYLDLLVMEQAAALVYHETAEENMQKAAKAAQGKG